MAEKLKNRSDEERLRDKLAFLGRRAIPVASLAVLLFSVTAHNSDDSGNSDNSLGRRVNEAPPDCSDSRVIELSNGNSVTLSEVRLGDGSCATELRPRSVEVFLGENVVCFSPGKLTHRFSIAFSLSAVGTINRVCTLPELIDDIEYLESRNELELGRIVLDDTCGYTVQPQAMPDPCLEASL